MKRLHIAVGVVLDAQGRVLISERRPGCAYAGQWEFPGGKVEPNETVEQALKRELQEELGLRVQAARPLIRVRHDYSDRDVLLDTWMVTEWSGAATAHEGQRFEWVEPLLLDEYRMLEANRPIVRAAQLPDRYLITPDPSGVKGDFLQLLDSSVRTHAIRLVRLRAWSLSDVDYANLARRCLGLCHNHGARLLLDRAPRQVTDIGADGWHASASNLAMLAARPIRDGLLFAASCHQRAELEQARALGADFAVLGPVLETTSHPARAAMGWKTFGDSATDARLPVYALGGVSPADLARAWCAGAQGIAAIRGLCAN